MQQRFHVSMSIEFHENLRDLPNAVSKRALRASSKMINDPWAKDLHPEKIKSAEPGIHSARVDDKYRIVWKHIKPNDIVLCFIDIHDDAYRRASRTSFTLSDGIIEICDTMEIDPNPEISSQNYGMFGERQIEAAVGKLLIGYKDQEILDFGVPEDVFPQVRALDSLDQLEQVERLLEEEVFDHLLSIAIGESHRLIVPDKALKKSLVKYHGGIGLYRFIDSDEFNRVLDGDMEEWMLFLAPHQREIVNRDYSGPARVRGVVGSGKTVVAIHRLRHLAQRAAHENKKVLFLTYGNRLPEITYHLFNRLVGNNAPELSAIECKTIHSWCGSFLWQHNIRNQIDQNEIQNALDFAIGKAIKSHPKFKMLEKSSTFFENEIRYAIKGQAIYSLDGYLGLDRSGRGTALNEDERRVMFQLYQDYQRYLEDKGFSDWDDLYLKALDLVESGIKPTHYIAAVLDEIQDLSAAVMRLVRGVIPKGSNDLFMVGDGLQRIYPGGYVLGQLGIDIVGRGELLRENYRNTHEILQAAYSMMENYAFDDLDSEKDQVPSPELSIRHGEKPRFHHAATLFDEMEWVVQQVRRLKAERRYQNKDFAFLYRWNAPYKQSILQYLTAELGQLVEVTKDPNTYFGEEAKFTTFHSAKGLEFKVVFILGVTDSIFVPKDDWSLSGKELEEYLAQERRLLYVAMTRARDLLYLTSSRGQPSRFLADIPDGFIEKT